MISLFINGQLCDISKDFGVRLNRKLISLSEFSLKDAQFSYTISLPATETNDRVFKFSRVEEVKGKFVEDYNAELVVKSVQVFKGKFRLSEISGKSYKGNLYLPPLKTSKDVFGDKAMSETVSVEIPFLDFKDTIEEYNRNANSTIQKVIFPLTLYGLPTKVGANYNTSTEEWGDKVRLGMHDIYPCVNVLSMLKDMFAGEGITLKGTALQDPDLQHLYLSYHNPQGTPTPWNYAKNGIIEVQGKWSNVNDMNTGVRAIERGSYDISGIYACDLFDCTNAKIEVIRDPGRNVLLSSVDKDNRTWRRTQIMVPVSGYYRVSLKAGSRILLIPSPQPDPKSGVSVLGTDVYTGGTGRIRTSVKLLRDRRTGNFGLSSSKMDGGLYFDNQPQNTTYDRYNTPKNLPFYKGANFGSDLFVDPLQNKYMLAGFQWGMKNNEDVHPKDIDFNYSYSLFAKPGYSWKRAEVGDVFNYLVTHTYNGYYFYTLPQNGGNPIWEFGDLYKYNLGGGKRNRALRGKYENLTGSKDVLASGDSQCIVWLDAGELLTVADVCDECEQGGKKGWITKESYFSLILEPFQPSKEWLKLGNKGELLNSVNWSGANGFKNGSIDITKFLPSDIKASDFIENFCKAFNLKLSHTGKNRYELNTPVSKDSISKMAVDLRDITSVEERSNLPLDLPEFYVVGFTEREEETGKRGKKFYIGGRSAGIEQKNFFASTRIRVFHERERIYYALDISKKEDWEKGYPDGIGKRHTDLPLRFFYHAGVQDIKGWGGEVITLSKPLYWRSKGIYLEYEEKGKNILTKYFPLLATRKGHYTEIETYLTPIQYEQLNGSRAVVFNDDVYLVAEINGYDPTGRNKSKIKLLKYEERV